MSPKSKNEVSLFRDKQHAIHQLNRWYGKLYHKLPDGGHFGWDWPTMRVCEPAIYNSFRRLHELAKPYRLSNDN